MFVAFCNSTSFGTISVQLVLSEEKRRSFLLEPHILLEGEASALHAIGSLKPLP